MVKRIEFRKCSEVQVVENVLFSRVDGFDLAIRFNVFLLLGSFAWSCNMLRIFTLVIECVQRKFVCELGLSTAHVCFVCKFVMLALRQNIFALDLLYKIRFGEAISK